MTHSSWHAADRPRRPVLFVNPKSGGGKATRADLAERARERGIEVIILSRDDNLAALVDEAVADGVDVLGVAGATDHSASSLQQPLNTSFLSSASPPAPVTTSRSTSASIAAI